MVTARKIIILLILLYFPTIDHISILLFLNFSSDKEKEMWHWVDTLDRNEEKLEGKKQTLVTDIRQTEQEMHNESILSN